MEWMPSISNGMLIEHCPFFLLPVLTRIVSYDKAFHLLVTVLPNSNAALLLQNFSEYICHLPIGKKFPAFHIGMLIVSRVLCVVQFIPVI